MSDSAKLSHTAALILQTIDQGSRYGFDIMDQTGLPSGTVYPALRRMEAEGLIFFPVGIREESDDGTTPGAQVLPHHASRFSSAGAGAETLSAACAIGHEPASLRLPMQPEAKRPFPVVLCGP